jgi:hypothetical protein
MDGQLFDIRAAALRDVIASGHVVAGSETPLATVPMVVVV